MQRSLLIAALLFSIFFLPWWVSAAVAVLFLFLVSLGIEVIVAGVLLDALFAEPTGGLWGITFLFTAGALILFSLVTYSKAYLSVYDRG